MRLCNTKILKLKTSPYVSLKSLCTQSRRGGGEDYYFLSFEKPQSLTVSLNNWNSTWYRKEEKKKALAQGSHILISLD